MNHTCHLVAPAPEDLSHLVELFTNPESRAFLGGPVEKHLAITRSLDWIERSSTEPIWTIRRNEDLVFLDYVLLDSHHDGEDIEISYALLPTYWGRGYATEALDLALTHAFDRLGFPKVIAETQARNLRSTRLLERIGMLPGKRLVRFGEEQSSMKSNRILSGVPIWNEGFRDRGPAPISSAADKRPEFKRQELDAKLGY